MQNPAFLKQFVSIVLLAWLAQTPVAHSALITLQPDISYAQTGDAISLDLVISDLGNFAPESLGAFDVSVGFDANVLSFVGYSLGGFLGDLGLLEAIDASSGDLGGAINVAVISLLSTNDLDTLQPGEFTLATLTFGVTDLAIGATTQLSILPGAVFGNAAGSALRVAASEPAVIEGSASIATPGTLLLLMSAVFGLIGVRRRHV